MRVLVVGGTQFIGRATVRALLDTGHSVTVLNRGKPIRPSGDSRGWRWRESLLDKRDGSLIMANPDQVARVAERGGAP